LEKLRRRSAGGNPARRGAKVCKRRADEEREQITRKKNRWVDRLSMMPVAERYALLSALEELGGTTPPYTTHQPGQW